MTRRDKLIWAAGFFDGEGCVSIGQSRAKYTCKDGRVSRFVSYNLALIVAQESKGPLDILNDLMKGKVTKTYRRGKLYWQWKTHGPEARDALIQLLPYLVVKRLNAELALRFQEIADDWNSKNRRNTGYPQEIKDVQEAMWKESKRLNSGEPMMPPQEEVIN